MTAYADTIVLTATCQKELHKMMVTVVVESEIFSLGLINKKT